MTKFMIGVLMNSACSTFRPEIGREQCGYIKKQTLEQECNIYT